MTSEQCPIHPWGFPGPQDCDLCNQKYSTMPPANALNLRLATEPQLRYSETHASKKPKWVPDPKGKPLTWWDKLIGRKPKLVLERRASNVVYQDIIIEGFMIRGLTLPQIVLGGYIIDGLTAVEPRGKPDMWRCSYTGFERADMLDTPFWT